MHFVRNDGIQPHIRGRSKDEIYALKAAHFVVVGKGGEKRNYLASDKHNALQTHWAYSNNLLSKWMCKIFIRYCIINSSFSTIDNPAYSWWRS